MVELINCQDAANYLGISVKTIRNWAQTGKISGKKIGSRGDWRFTREDLANSTDVNKVNFSHIKAFLLSNAEAIQHLASEKHIVYLGTKNATSGNLKKNREDYIEIVQQYAENLETIDRGQKIFRKLGTQIALKSVEQGLTLEETVDGTTFLKQAFWEKLEASGYIYKLTAHDQYTFNAIISLFSDIVTSKIVFAFDEHRTQTEAALEATIETQELSDTRFKMLAENIQNLAWMAQADGYIYWYNKRWYDYTGTQPKDMEGWGWQSVHDPKILPEVLKRWKACITAGEPFDMTFPLRGADGIFRPFITRVMPVKNKAGKVVHWTGTNTDISDRVQLEKAQKLAEKERIEVQRLEKVQSELLKINQVKDEFIGIASHQLRTPATAVKQYLGIVINGLGGDLTEKQRTYLQIAYDSNERELNLINGLLKTAQIDAETFTLNRRLCNVADLLREIELDLQLMFTTRKQSLALKVHDQNVSARIDPLEISQVITNLLENASKYSYEGSRITVTLEKKSDQATISIADNGVGIATDDQAKIFEKFTRINNELSDTVTGTGLGLYWAKHIIALHGGTIRVRSNIKAGATFIVELPL